MARLIFTKKFIKLLDKIDPGEKRKVMRSLEELKENPTKGKLLRGYYEVPAYGLKRMRLRSLRIGDYRVIYYYDASSDIIWLLLVGHRSWIYRKLP